MNNYIKRLLVFSLTFCLGAGLGKFGRTECTSVAAISQPVPRVTKPAQNQVSIEVKGVLKPLANYPFAVRRSETFIRRRVLQTHMDPPSYVIRNILGITVVNVLISQSGKVIHTWGEDENSRYFKICAHFAKQWRFHPLVIKGKKVGIQSKLTFRFTC